MTYQILQVSFRFAVSNDEFTKDATRAAEEFARVPGLRWKIWLMSEDRHEGGGIYLFEDESSLQAFLKGELLASMKSNPVFKNLTLKQFSYLPNATKTTRGPV